jgi:hypothetical protein
MAGQTAPAARLTGAWRRPYPHIRRDRRRRQIGPVVEALERRLPLAGTSPSNAVPIGAKPDGTVNPRALGAAYQQVVAIQTTTLQSLGDSYRKVQAAGAQFASRAAVAINELKAELSQVRGTHESDAIGGAIGRDLNLLDRGGAAVSREEQGLDVARGLADQQANSSEIDIVDGLLTALPDLVQQNQSTGTAISRSGQRSANALIRELKKLGFQLISSFAPSISSAGISPPTR